KDFELIDKTFTEILIPGCISPGREVGSPNIPVNFVNLLIPQGHIVKDIEFSANSNIYDTTSFDLENNPIIPYQKPMTLNELGDPRESIDYNQDIYSSDNLFPENILENQGVAFCRGYSILTVAINPVQYIPCDGTIIYTSKIDLEIVLESTGDINCFYRDNKNDENWVKNLVYNPEVADGYNKAGLSFGYSGGICDPSDYYDYVIITTEQNNLDHWTTNTATPYNWTSLMNKHQIDDGLSCILVTIQDIDAESDYYNSTPLFNDTEAHIREFCKDAYQDWNTEYILVGGDQNWIHRRLLDYAYESNCESDLYWSNLDNTFNEDQDNDWGEEGDAGFDLYSELYIGSLPCDEPQDVSNWMKKSFYYADAVFKDYLENAAFYGGDTTWSCQGDDFVDYSAIKGTDYWLGPIPEIDGPFPDFAGFQFGFETWNENNIGQEFNLSVKWTAEPPNPGWNGGSESQAINGLKNDINNDQVTLISAIAHADSTMSLDVSYYSWESDYHNTKPFFITDMGCHCGDMDASDDGVLHSMLFHSDTELAFGCIYNTGYGWGNADSTNSSSAFQQKCFWDYMFDTLNHSGTTFNWQLGKAQAWSKDFMAPTINWDPSYGSWRDIIETCLLFADPAQKIKSPEKPEHNIGIQNLGISDHELHDTNITISTTLYNNGENNETNVYVSLRTNGTESANQTIVFFEKDTFTNINWLYHTPYYGWEYISVNITTVPGENITLDNEIEKKVIYGPDIAVTDIEAPDILEQGNAESVKGYIQNLGLTNENNIDILLIADDTIINSTSIDLNIGESTYVTFIWDGLTSGTGIYNISVFANPVTNESYTSNQIQSKLVKVGSITTVFVDDFEDENGWTVEDDPYITTGTWERGIPVGGGDRGDPAFDYDGSSKCFVTENIDGDYDVDDGITWLISPDININSELDAKIDYALWYTNDYGNDPNNDLFEVYVSNDNGANWVLAQTIGPQTLVGWNEFSFLAGDHITLSNTIKIRFEASDLNDGSVVEAGVDAFKVSIFDYSPLGPELSYSPGSYDFGVMDLNQTSSTTFQIWNDGTDILNYSFSESCSWLTLYPMVGNSTGEHDTITISINTTGLFYGAYSYPININTNDENKTFTVDVYISNEEYVDIQLLSGWNLISVPLDNDWYASDLVNNVSGCSYVVKWDSVNQSFWIYVPGFPAFDFPLLPGHGYFVEMNTYNNLFNIGYPVTSVNISLKVGVNLIGWYHNQNTTASSILENISNCSSIIRWDPVVQDYWLYLPGYPAFDFVVTQGMGLFVDVNQESYWHGEG
ncbi:MAG: hypothetical protein BV456_04690, partial [Thermoplasmata archaeon M8B2D]